MLAPKCATYHGRSTFANPKYLKKAQSDKPRLYEIPYDTSDPANRFCPDGEDTVSERRSRSKLDKDKVKPYNYTYQNSLYETFKPPSKAYLDQLERAKEVRKTMWRKTFVRTKPNIAKNMKNNPVCKENASNVFRKEREQYHEIQDLKAQMQDKNMVINELKKLILRPRLSAFQVKDKVVPNNSHVKFQKKEVETIIGFLVFSKKTKSIMGCNDSFKLQTSNANDVCADMWKMCVNSNHDAVFLDNLIDRDARTKKPRKVPISASQTKRERKTNLFATPHRKQLHQIPLFRYLRVIYKKLLRLQNSGNGNGG
ncbi:hypothetical protein Tco_0876551 [Tanacetum coccineum]|uniref:Uncharacterized protein n=1 Tax=Tanacetum coccineum TaxID=301880 RepID=A0ABQ5BSM3_9ASTR